MTVINASQFQVGDGATIYGHSDRRAYTVIKITKTTVTLRRDKATLLNGFKSGEPDALVVTPGGFSAHTSGTQRYKIVPDPDGEVIVARNTKRGLRCSLGMVITGRHEFYDFNF